MRMTIAILAALLTATLNQAAGPKLATDLQNTASDSIIDVIVQYRRPPTESHHRRVLERGGQLKRNLDIIRAAHYSVPAKQIESLSKDPDVEFISPDRAVFSTATPVYTGSPDYGWRTAGADLATSVFGVDGTGVGIAMIDSGINDSDDLKDALAARGSNNLF